MIYSFMSLRPRSFKLVAAIGHTAALKCSPCCLPRRPHAPLLRAYRAFATEATFTSPSKPPRAGQPTFESHPHLGERTVCICLLYQGDLTSCETTVQPNEITPGIPAEEYERRRAQLMNELPEGSAVVSVAGQVKYMSGSECLLTRSLFTSSDHVSVHFGQQSCAFFVLRLSCLQRELTHNLVTSSVRPRTFGT